MRLTGPAQVFDIDPFTTSTTQQEQLGSFAFDTLGRKYKYCKVGAVALVVGNLIQSPARDVQFTDMAVTASAASQNVANVTNGTTTVASGDFSNGIMSVTVTPGLGQNFAIKGHSTGGSGAALTFTLYENIVTALTTSSKVTIAPNKYNGVIQSPTTRTGKTIGVALAAIPAASFGWIATQGEFGVLSDATVAAVGQGVAPSTTTAGAVTLAVTLLERIGTAAILGVSAKCEPVFLELP